MRRIAERKTFACPLESRSISFPSAWPEIQI